MARARSLKPGFFTDENLVDLGPWAMLCFAGLWTIADREGRLEERPKFIKAQIFPYSAVKVEKLIDQLVDANFLIRYEHGDKRYLQVRTWNKHQNPHVKEAASTIPAPCEHCASTVQVLPLSGTKTPLTLNPVTDTPESHAVKKLEPRFPAPTKEQEVTGSILQDILKRHREIGYRHSIKTFNVEREWSQALGKRPDDPIGQAKNIDAAHRRACETNTWQGGFIEAPDKWIQREGWRDDFPAPEWDGYTVVNPEEAVK